MFVLFILGCPGMLLNCKLSRKNVNEYCLHFSVCLFSLLTFKMVLMTLLLALMKVQLFFSFVCRMTHMNV